MFVQQRKKWAEEDQERRIAGKKERERERKGRKR